MDAARVVNVQEMAQTRIAELAGQIKNNKHLAQILRTAKVGLREDVFAELEPYLKFKAWKYTKLSRFF
jgi:hypothetical protein